jgi:hypothetical protein
MPLSLSIEWPYATSLPEVTGGLAGDARSSQIHITFVSLLIIILNII